MGLQKETEAALKDADTNAISADSPMGRANCQVACTRAICHELAALREQLTSVIVGHTNVIAMHGSKP